MALVLFCPRFSLAGTTLHKSVYLIGEDILPTAGSAEGTRVFVYDISFEDETGPVAYIFDFTAGIPLDPHVGAQTGDYDQTRDPFGYIFVPAAYMAIESGASCATSFPNSWRSCLEQPETLSSSSFSVIERVSNSSGGETGGSVLARNPEVKILNPQGGSYADFLEIKYSATDANSEQDHKLGEKPVSIFYTDQLDIWDQRVVLPEIKNLIVKDLPVSGIYKWDIGNLSDSERYRIVIDAIDNSGLLGEDVSDFFTIDRIAPTFKILAEPPVSRGEDIDLTIEASEDLSQSPEAKISQRGSSPVTIFPTGGPKIWKAKYHVISGYDGPAKIEISGKDSAGNFGSLIISGGRFSVGVQPPPKPVVVFPLDKEVVASDLIEVRGGTREDTRLILTVNGRDKYTAQPDEKGNFIFKEVKLDPQFSRGVNVLSLVAEDGAGSISEEAVLNLKFNLSPQISFLYPKRDAVASGTVAIQVSARDDNRDLLVFTYEVSSDEGLSWNVLTEKLSNRNYLWTTTDYPDGNYLARVTASDGSTSTQVVSDRFTIRNLLPSISFEGGSRIVINKSDYVLRGKVKNPVANVNVDFLEYSVDGGASWKKLAPDDLVFDSAEEAFNLPLSNLKEGIYEYVFRTKARAGEFYGRARINLVVDFGPPEAPIVDSPKASEVFSNSADLDKNAAGLQLRLTGRAEAGSKVSVAGDSVFTSRVNEKGVYSAEITLKKHGQNNLKIFATDAAGNQSPETLLAITYNNPPVVKFLNPRNARGLNHKAQIRWEVYDPDLDPIKNFSLSYAAGNSSFKVLTRSAEAGALDFDVSALPQSSNYQLKIEASDGLADVVEVINFSVDNVAPEIFVDPLVQTVFTKKFILSVNGRANDDFSGIEYVEYSLDGEHWYKATIAEGFVKRSAKFYIKDSLNLEDGDYLLRFRSVDAAGNYSDIDSKTISIDTKAPRIGSYQISRGTLMLFPVEDGVFHIPLGSVLDFNLSLEEDTRLADVFIAN